MAQPKLRFPEFNGGWKEKKLGDIVFENIIPTDKPIEDYERLGIRSHCKGTFHEKVKIENALEADKMYTVPMNHLIVNITFAWEQAIAITDESDEGKYVSGRFPTYKFKQGELPYFYKFIITSKRLKYDMGIASPGGAGRNRVLNKKLFLQIQIATTMEKEQQKIADFLSSIDTRIVTQQKIVSDLEEQKKGIMQKIFNREIKFKKDDGNEYPDWKEKKFGDVFCFLQSNTFSRAELNYLSGNTKNIHYGDVLIKYNNAVDIQSKSIPYINDEIDLSKFKEDSYLQDGDLIIADTAEDYSVGKATEIINTNGIKVLSGLHTFACRPKYKFASKYLGHYFNSNLYHKQLVPLITGTKVSSISKSSIVKTKVVIPDIGEQQKIANFLTAIDNRIEKEKEILSDWQEIKKGLLQQMFV